MKCTVTFGAGSIKYIDMTPLKLQFFLDQSNGLVALTAMKLTDMKIEMDLRNKRQYPIGISVALIP